MSTPNTITSANLITYKPVKLDPIMDLPNTGDNYYINTRIQDQFTSDVNSVKRFRFIAIYGEYLRQYFNEDNLEQRKLSKNIQKLVEFQSLTENWDDEDAIPIPQPLIFEVYSIIIDPQLLKQPFLSPLATGGILLSFTSWKNNSMDVFITDQEYTVIITSTKKGKKNFTEKKSNRIKIIKLIQFFYASY